MSRINLKSSDEDLAEMWVDMYDDTMFVTQVENAGHRQILMLNAEDAAQVLPHLQAFIARASEAGQ